MNAMKTFRDKLNKGTKDFEKLSGQHIPAGYYSWVVSFIEDLIMSKGSRRCLSLHNSSKGEATANVHLEDKSYTIAEVNAIIDEMWLDKEKTRYDVGWNSALAELEGRLKIKSMQTKPNLGKSKDKLGDDFTKFLESEGYEVIDCKPEDTL